MKKVLILFFIGVIGFGLALGEAPSIYAQEGDVDEFTLEEITVTAQKREEDLQKVPIAMDTISGHEMREMGMTNLEEALATLPSVIVQRMGNRLNVSIRGIDNDYSPDVSNSMVAQTYDGIYSSVAGIDASGLYDTSRIEVLAGPQGTLYSRASTGGVVNIVSNNPIDEFDMSASIEAGSYHLLNTQAMVNVPLNDKFAFRTAFSTQFHEGYISNGTDDNDTKAGRVKLKYDPQEDLSFIFSVDYVKMGGKGSGENSPFSVGVNLFGTEQPDDPWISDLDPKNFRVDRDIVKIYTEMNWDLGFGELVFLPAITRMKQDLLSGMLFFPFGPAQPGASSEPTEGFTHALGHQNEVSGELRLSSSEDSFMKWMAGAYYYNRRYQYLSIESDHSNERWYENPSKAIFANATYPVSDRIRANLGGRYTQDLQTSHVIDRWFPGYSSPFGPGPAGFDTDVKFVDYKLGFEYDISENSMLWVDYSTGSRAGMRGWPDETLDAYQVGTKNRFLDDRFQFNLSSYYYAYENYEVRAPSLQVSAIGDDGLVYTVMDRGDGSGGEATIIGFELATSYLATANDRFDVNIAYQNGEVSAMTFIYDYSPPMDIAGGKLNNSPEFTIFGSYQHEFHLNNGGSVIARVEQRYQTESFVMMNAIYNEGILRNVPAGMSVEAINTNPSHSITNASIRYGPPGGRWSLNAYIKNIENHAEKKNLLNNALRIGPPRTFGAVLSAQY